MVIATIHLSKFSEEKINELIRDLRDFDDIEMLNDNSKIKVRHKYSLPGDSLHSDYGLMSSEMHIMCLLGKISRKYKLKIEFKA